MPYASEAIAEIIPTIQCEIKVGEPAILVRFNGCNLVCDWCDTKYTWRKIAKITDEDIQAIIDAQRNHPEIKTLMITGGEPTIYADQELFGELLSIIFALNKLCFSIFLKLKYLKCYKKLNY